MRDKLIAAIREVPISKTYEEYVEALADHLIDKVYPKTSGVAREIFEEIGKTLHRWDSLAEQDHTDYGELMELVVGDVISNIAELKKKYTEGEK